MVSKVTTTAAGEHSVALPTISILKVAVMAVIGAEEVEVGAAAVTEGGGQRAAGPF